MTLKPGETILNGRYRIEAFVGEGVSAQVYRAIHVELHAPRALKVLRHDAPGIGSLEYSGFRQRFQLEAQLGAKLDHPHIIRVHDFEQNEEVLVLAMEYASGGSLADRITAAKESGRPLPIAECVRMAGQIAAGLAAIHGLDVVHRDVKPSNILFDGKGNAKIADLGLAQVAGGLSRRSVLGEETQWHPGTPEYMSPEQQSIKNYLTPASDVYGMGCVVFEMLTGRVKRSVKPGTRVRALRADVPEWLDELVARMTAVEHEARPWDGGEVVQAIEEGQARREAEARAVLEAERDRQRREAEEQAQQQAAEEAGRKQAEEEQQQQKTGLILTLAPGITLELVRVPAGEFLMGDNYSGRGDEEPQHTVYLDAYGIGKTPITNIQYAVYAKAAKLKWSVPAGKADHPVKNVSWDDAAAFCKWASQETGQNIQLPTEARWEKAARGTDVRAYPWGNQQPDANRCNFARNVKDTTSVGKYSPGGDSPYGCVDMAGNVWEVRHEVA